jgi:hypothetical protein
MLAGGRLVGAALVTAALAVSALAAASSPAAADADVLLGQQGRDYADGGTGRDACSAERKRNCP